MNKTRGMLVLCLFVQQLIYAGYKEKVYTTWLKKKKVCMTLLSDKKSLVVPIIGLALCASMVALAYNKGRLIKIDTFNDNSDLDGPFLILARQHCAILIRQKDNEKNNKQRLDHIGRRLGVVEERQKLYHMKTLECFQSLNKLFKKLLEDDETDGKSAEAILAECDKLTKEWGDGFFTSSSVSSSSH